VFELLEEYARLWYEKRYHDEAKAALRKAERFVEPQGNLLRFPNPDGNASRILNKKV
jgi:hypothetical protein